MCVVVFGVIFGDGEVMVLVGRIEWFWWWYVVYFVFDGGFVWIFYLRVEDVGFNEEGDLIVMEGFDWIWLVECVDVWRCILY